jgi:hypothetical protein
MIKRPPNWGSILLKVAILGSVWILANFLLIYLFGPQIWSHAGYFFGNDARTTLSILLFIEGGVLLAMGTLWASGSMDNVYYGKYGKTTAALSKEDWEQRKEQTENPSIVVKILMLTGGLLLIASFVLLLI